MVKDKVAAILNYTDLLYNYYNNEEKDRAMWRRKIISHTGDPT